MRSHARFDSRFARPGIWHQRSKGRVKRPDSLMRPPQAETSVELLGDNEYPKVIVRSKAHGKMRALVQACPIEVSWWSPVERTHRGNVVVTDVFVPDQVCTYGSTDITAEGEAALQLWFINRGRTDVINQLKCWGHSHGQMPVFSSSTDDRQTEVYLNRFDDFFLRLIVNHADHLDCSLFLIDEGYAIHQPEMILEPFKPGRWDEWAAQQIERRVARVNRVRSTIRELDGVDWGDASMATLERWKEDGVITPHQFAQISTRVGNALPTSEVPELEIVTTEVEPEGVPA